MTELSLQPFAKISVPFQPKTMDRSSNRFSAASGRRDLMIVAAFCAIGLVLSFAVWAQMPDFSDVIGQINLVP